MIDQPQDMVLLVTEKQHQVIVLLGMEQLATSKINRQIIRYHIDGARCGLFGRPVDHKVIIAKYWPLRESVNTVT